MAAKKRKKAAKKAPAKKRKTAKKAAKKTARKTTKKAAKTTFPWLSANDLPGSRWPG